MTNKNLPDRIKLVLQFVVFTIATCFILFFIFIPILKHLDISDVFRKLMLLGIPVFSILTQGAIFVCRWKKLLQREKTGEFPDMQDMRNITPSQMIFLVIGLPFLLASIVLFQLYSKLAGVLCFIIFLMIWVIDTMYTRKRQKKIKEADQYKTPGNGTI